MTRFMHLVIAASAVLAAATARRQQAAPAEIVRPDDRAWRGAGPEPTVEIVQSPSVRVDGFDWADAGIGAAAALGFGLLLAGAAALVLRRQRVAAFSKRPLRHGREERNDLMSQHRRQELNDSIERAAGRAARRKGVDR